MKKLLLLLALTLGFTAAHAQYLKGHRYRGYAENQLLVGNDGVYEGCNTYGGGVVTSHGYQINPHIFVGGGIGLSYYKFDEIEGSDENDGNLAVPLFANARFNFGSGRVTPYVDAKLGYAVGDLQGLYASPAVGVRIGIKGKFAINVSTGYTAQQYTYEDSYYTRHKLHYSEKKKFAHTFTLSVGVEW